VGLCEAFVRFPFYAAALKFGLLYEDLTLLHFLIRPSMARVQGHSR
jgi:hypothetical protein